MIEIPGNIISIKISINDSIEYYVGDSKMESLINWLDENGFREAKDNNQNKE